MNLRAIYDPYSMQGAEEALRGLRDDTSVPCQLLINALRQFFSREVSTIEKPYLSRIKALRLRLAKSREPLSQIDYGAGHAESGSASQGMSRDRMNLVTVGKVFRDASVPPIWGFLLFRIIREFKPTSCLELGTSLGISAGYEAAALELNGSGRIVTLEGSEAVAARAREHLVELGLNATVITGRFQDNLGSVLQAHRPVDYAFIDGHHDEHATLDYFELISSHLSPTAVIVFDDISWSPGMRRAWDTIIADQRVKIAVDFSKLGVCIMANSIERRQAFRCSLSRWQKALVRVGTSDIG